jgi:hypothetical protein
MKTLIFLLALSSCVNIEYSCEKQSKNQAGEYKYEMTQSVNSNIVCMSYDSACFRVANEVAKKYASSKGVIKYDSLYDMSRGVITW